MFTAVSNAAADEEERSRVVILPRSTHTITDVEKFKVRKMPKLEEVVLRFKCRKTRSGRVYGAYWEFITPKEQASIAF